VQMIDTAAVHKVLTPIWTSTPKMAARVRARMEAVLDWAKVLGYRNGPLARTPRQTAAPTQQGATGPASCSPAIRRCPEIHDTASRARRY
jgi:integrase-like protein